MLWEESIAGTCVKLMMCQDQELEAACCVQRMAVGPKCSGAGPERVSRGVV